MYSTFLFATGILVYGTPVHVTPLSLVCGMYLVHSMCTLSGRKMRKSKGTHQLIMGQHTIVPYYQEALQYSTGICMYCCSTRNVPIYSFITSSHRYYTLQGCPFYRIKQRGFKNSGASNYLLLL